MKNTFFAIGWGIILLIFVNCPLVLCAGQRGGDFYYQRGKKKEALGYYGKARRDYMKAVKHYHRKANTTGLNQAKKDLFRVEVVLEEYCLKAGRLKGIVRKYYPWAKQGEVKDWIANKIFLKLNMGGKTTRYFEEEVGNLRFRNPEIMDGVVEHMPSPSPLDSLFQDMLDNYINADYTGYDLPFDRPKDMLIDFQLRIKRSKLPKDGDRLVRVWMPIPINTDCQGDIEIVSMEPSAYLVNPPDFDANVGLAYFEIPIAEMQKGLVVRAQIRYQHFQQRFEIDSSTIEPYDKGSDLYITYTGESQNIQITPEISELALTIVGSETNPYLQAKLIYDYILNDIDYSFTPHGSLQATGESESEFVRKNQYGDCGAQSMFFAALCRSLGIPARANGGYQMLSGKPGSHFWAEFYLPAPYGSWIPVDVTVAGIWKEVRDFSEIDMAAYQEYFFGQQDPLRLVIQNDVDLNLSPVPTEDTYFKIVVQDPVVIYAGSKTIPLDVDTYQNSYMDFNFDQAYTLTPGANFTVAASDFGLDSFPKDSKLFLRDQYLGEVVEEPVSIQGDPEGKLTLSCKLPKNLSKIAYSLWLESLSEDDHQSSKYVIMQTQ